MISCEVCVFLSVVLENCDSLNDGIYITIISQHYTIVHEGIMAVITLQLVGAHFILNIGMNQKGLETCENFLSSLNGQSLSEQSNSLHVNEKMTGTDE